MIIFELKDVLYHRSYSDRGSTSLRCLSNTSILTPPSHSHSQNPSLPHMAGQLHHCSHPALWYLPLNAIWLYDGHRLESHLQPHHATHLDITSNCPRILNRGRLYNESKTKNCCHKQSHYLRHICTSRRRFPHLPVFEGSTQSEIINATASSRFKRFWHVFSCHIFIPWISFSSESPVEIKKNGN